MVAGWLAFGTGEGLLGYGICVPCAKRLPGVRDAFSEALRAKNRLLVYGAQFIQRRAAQETAFWCMERSSEVFGDRAYSINREFICPAWTTNFLSR